MVWHQIYLGLTLVIILTIIQNGDALQCWMCNSAFDITCRDYFNVTRIQENIRYVGNVVNENVNIQPVTNYPHLNRCDETHPNYNYKNVCLKRVERGFNGIPVVRRECRLVPQSLKIGECPEELKNNKDLKYCGTCETDKCNEATGITTNSFLTVGLSASLLLLLRN